MDERVLVCFGDSNTHGSPPVDRRARAALRPGRAVARRAGRGARAVVAGARGGPAGADDRAPGPGRGRPPVRARRAADGARHALPDRRPGDHAGHERPQGPLRRRARRHRRRPSSGWCRADARSARRRAGRCRGSCSIAPAPVIEVGEIGEMFAGGAEKSRRLGPMLRATADRLGVGLPGRGRAHPHERGGRGPPRPGRAPGAGRGGRGGGAVTRPPPLPGPLRRRSASSRSRCA